MIKFYDKICQNIVQQLYSVDTCLKQEEFPYLLYIIMRPCLIILIRYESGPRHFFTQL